MAISMSTFGVGLCYTGQLPLRRVTGETGRKKQRMAVVRAEAGGEGINLEIRKNEEKVVDSVVVTELSKNITPYCRWTWKDSNGETQLSGPETGADDYHLYM